MTVGSSLVDWAALAKSLGVAFAVVLFVAVCFALVVRGEAGLGVVAILHKCR
jgi:hypothetical protein